jgi:hypothetical protein
LYRLIKQANWRRHWMQAQITAELWVSDAGTG